MYEKIKKWYTQSLWSAQMVRQAVQKGVISQSECDAILTGQKLKEE